MRKRLFPLLFLLIALPALSLAEGLDFTVFPRAIRPGKTERISFSAPESGTATIFLADLDGETVAMIQEGLDAAEGVNHLSWNGCDSSGNPVAPGEYALTLRLNGQTASQNVTVGEESPQLLSVESSEVYLENSQWSVTVQTNMPGTLLMRIKLDDGEWHTAFEKEVPAGQSSIAWNGKCDEKKIPYGEYTVQLRLTDETGFSGTAKQSTLRYEQVITPSPVPTATPRPTPPIVIPSAVKKPADESSYWTLPVGVMDEHAIWEIMMQPLTVIDGNQQEVYRLRKTPDGSLKRDNIVGEITYASQGVHILETLDNGWTLVEAYNSSYGPNCKSRPGYGVTDDLIQGYVKTSLLKTINPVTDYALLIDKMEQKMYIFSEGRIIGELLVSTGLNNKTQSWNETPSGEFVVISPKMGGFAAGNLWCAYGMRLNGGCAIHQVPYIGDQDTPESQRDYSSTVKMLGQKASHGCIRVQKELNEQGQNMKWLWDHLKKYTKVLIWDDTGRFVDYPADETPLYYNPNGGKYFHEDQRCSSVKSRYLPLKAFTYGELDNEPFAALTPCSRCVHTIQRKREIDELNRANGF